MQNEAKGTGGDDTARALEGSSTGGPAEGAAVPGDTESGGASASMRQAPIAGNRANEQASDSHLRHSPAGSPPLPADAADTEATRSATAETVASSMLDLAPGADATPGDPARAHDPAQWPGDEAMLDDGVTGSATSLDEDHQFAGPEGAAAELPTPDVSPSHSTQGPAFGPVVAGRDGWLIRESTRDLYQDRVRWIWRSTASSMGSDPEAGAIITPMDVVEHFIRRGRGDPGVLPLKLSSWLAYRSALLWDFSRHPHLGEYVVALRTLEDSRHPVPELATKMQTIARKQRAEKSAIPRKDLKALLDELGGMNRFRQWGAKVQYWLQAGIATGIRPGEWEHTRWGDADKTWLLAPTYKEKADIPSTLRRRTLIDAAEQGRSPDEIHKPAREHLAMRAIPIDSSDRILVIMHMLAIEEAAARGTPFTKYQDYCRQTLWRACRRLWETKRYGLYNARHQFSANSKQRLSPEEVGQLMGHTDARASHRHYAPAKRAYKKGAEQKNTQRPLDAETVAGQGPAASPWAQGVQQDGSTGAPSEAAGLRGDGS